MCVCKQWRSFLSTPWFGRMHLQHHGTTINDYKLLLFDETSSLRTLSLNQTIPSNPYRNNLRPIPNQQVFVLASLDGLVCLTSMDSPQLVFWNPFTGAYRKLSPNPYDYSFCSEDDVVGFYKDSSNDYKLLHLSCLRYEVGAYIYSHRSDTWTQIGFFDFPPTKRTFTTWSPATFCSQCLYFTVKVDLSFLNHQWWVICFDVETETFRKINFPHPVPDGTADYCGSLVVLNGCLHLCVSYINLDPWSKQGHLWRMDGDDGWVKVAAFSDPADGISDALWVEFASKQSIICIAGSIGNWLVVLDQENDAFKKVKAEDFTTRYLYFCSPTFWYRSSRMIYVETLVSPHP